MSKSEAEEVEAGCALDEYQVAASAIDEKLDLQLTDHQKVEIQLILRASFVPKQL